MNRNRVQIQVGNIKITRNEIPIKKIISEKNLSPRKSFLKEIHHHKINVTYSFSSWLSKYFNQPNSRIVEQVHNQLNIHSKTLKHNSD